MKDNYTHISIVLDRSGSMASCKLDTIGGFNTFLKDQQQVPGEATLTLMQFDTEHETLCQGKAIAEVLPLTDQTFVPRGGTALLDAIGRTIADTGQFLGALDEASRPSKVVFAILTDGEENSSREFNSAKINDLISHQRDIYKWEFVFLGANQDAITTASKLGVSATNAMTYAANPGGTGGGYSSLSSNVAKYRVGAVDSMSFTKEDREKQKKAGLKP